MDDPLGVRGGERVGDLDRELDRGLDLHRFAADVLLERPALQQLHDDEPPPLPLADVVDRADVRVVERRGGARLAQVAVDGFRVLGALLGNELQRDVAMEASVLGLPDDAHPALADLLDQAVVQQLLSGFDGHFRSFLFLGLSLQA